MTTLRERCQAVVDKISRDAILRQGSAADTLLEFVLAEKGRAAAADRLAESLPLVLYFTTDADREDFIAVIHEAKPGMIVRTVP